MLIQLVFYIKIHSLGILKESMFSLKLKNKKEITKMKIFTFLLLNIMLTVRYIPSLVLKVLVS